MSMSITDIFKSIDVSTLRPTQDYLLVKDLSRDKTAGGILLPKESSELRFVEVIAVGPGLFVDKFNAYEPVDFRKGEKLLIMDYAGEYLESGVDRYRFVRSNGVWAKIEFADQGTFSIHRILPVMDKLVIKIKDQEVSPGGIVLPDDLKLKWATAKVVFVSEGLFSVATAKWVDLEVKPSEKIVFMRYAGANIEVAGEKYRIIQKADILSVVEE